MLGCYTDSFLIGVLEDPDEEDAGARKGGERDGWQGAW